MTITKATFLCDRVTDLRVAHQGGTVRHCHDCHEEIMVARSSIEISRRYDMVEFLCHKCSAARTDLPMHVLPPTPEQIAELVQELERKPS